MFIHWLCAYLCIPLPDSLSHPCRHAATAIHFRCIDTPGLDRFYIMRGYFIGGCHVNAFPFAEEVGFSYQVGHDQNMKTCEVTPHTSIPKLPKAIAGIATAEKQVIVFQLGNYEFNGSLASVLKTVFNLKLKRRKTAPASVTTPVLPAAVPTGLQIDPAFASSKKTQALLSNQHKIKQCLLGRGYCLLYLFGFFVMNRHGVSFKVLNQFIASHPRSCIIFLTPFPAVSYLDNQLRKLGGWIMRRKIKSLSNVHWIDTHQLIPAHENSFVDDAHITEQGHNLLANAINTVIETHMQKLQLTLPGC